MNIQAGIIGCGAIFPMHAYPLSRLDGVDIAGICDIDEEKAKKAAEKFNCKYYTDYKKMLEDVDVVHLCVPHYLHPIIAIDALKAGCCVLTEKPMAIDYPDAVNMLKTAQDNNVVLGVIFQNRYNSASQLIKKTLDSGELGNVTSARLNVCWNRSEEYYSSTPWKGTWNKEGGGVLINQAIHTFDLVRWFIDSEVSGVDAYITNRFHPNIQVEDSAEGVIQFQNGAIAIFQAVNYYGYDAPVQIELYCEKGLVNMIGDRAMIKFANGKSLTAGPDTEKADFGGETKSYWGTAHEKQIKRFYDCLSNDKELDITAEDALKTQKMICDIYDSGKMKLIKQEN